MKKFLYVLIFIFSLSLLFTGIAFAQEPLPSDDEVNAVASQLYCRSAKARRWMYAPLKPAANGAT